MTRLHSSNFGRICTATDATNFTKLAHSFTQYKHLNTEPIKHGKKYESVALNEYMAKTQVVVNARVLWCAEVLHIWLVLQMV